MIFPTKVNGIPCQCRVLQYTPEVPAKTYGPPEDCYPSEPEEFDFELLDRKGKRASWLDRYVTPAVVEYLAEENHIMQQAEMYAAY